MVQSALKFKKEEVFTVDYDDLNDFISDEYGQEFCFCSDEEVGNYSSKEYKVDKRRLSEWDLKAIENFKEGTPTIGVTCHLLTDLCNQDKIPEGKYIVKVSW